MFNEYAWNARTTIKSFYCHYHCNRLFESLERIAADKIIFGGLVFLRHFMVAKFSQVKRMRFPSISPKILSTEVYKVFSKRYEKLMPRELQFEWEYECVYVCVCECVCVTHLIE